MLEKFLKNPSGLFLINVKEVDDPLKWFKSFLQRLKTTLAIKIISSQELFEELNSFGFFEKDQLLVLTQAEKLKKKEIDLLLGASRPLLILSKGIKASHLLYKMIDKDKGLLDLSLETKSQREKRMLLEIASMAKLEGKTIAQEAALFLVSQVSEDIELVGQEIFKLATFIGDRKEITLKDAALLTFNCKDESVFKLMDALFAKKSDLALHLSRKLMQDESSIFPLLRAMRSQIQIEMQVASIMKSSSRPEHEIQSLFPYMKGLILDLHMNTARKLGIKTLQAALLAVDQVDFLAKNGNENEEILLDLLVTRLISK